MDGRLKARTAAAGETEQAVPRWRAEPAGWRLTGEIWVAAIGLAAIGTAIAFDAAPGVNWGIWATLAALALGRFGARVSGVRTVDPVARWCLGLTILVAWGAAVTANNLFQAFILIACVVLLATATRVIGGLPGARVGTVAMAWAPLTAFVYATGEAGRRLAAAGVALRGERHAPIVRGLAFAIPVAAVFALVLAGADPMLTAGRDLVMEALSQLSFIPRAVFFVGLGTIVLGACGLAARRSGAAGPAGAAGAEARTIPMLPLRLGPTDRKLVVGAVASVFGAFLALQPAYLFRDTDALRVSGMTYTEYAHRGFSELTLAATLCVALVIALDRYRSPDGPDAASGTARRQWGTLLLIAEVLVVLISAFHRLTVYEAAYGYTMLRLYVQAYVVGVGAALVLLAREVARMDGAFDARRVARRTGVVAMAFLAVFSFANPESWVVGRDGARYRATGKLDTAYLASLSLNAVPAIVTLAQSASPVCADYIRRDLGRTFGTSAQRRWFEWNLRRERAIAAFHAADIHTRLPMPAMPGTGCDEAPATAR